MRITAGLRSLGDTSYFSAATPSGTNYTSHLPYFLSTSPFRTKVGSPALCLTPNAWPEDADPSLAAEEEEDSVHLAVREWIVVQRMTAIMIL